MGLSPESVEGHTLFDVFAPELAGLLAAHYGEALAGQASSTQTAFGGRVYLQRLAPLLDGEGAVVAGIHFTEDVTAARQATQELSESEEQFRTAFDRAPVGQALIGMDFRYLKVNRALCEMTGYTDTELQAMTSAGLTHPDDLAAGMAGMARLLAGDLATYTSEKRYVTAAGNIIWATTSSSLLRRQDGSPLNFISQIQNTTERRNQDHVLAEERRRLRAAHSIGHIGSWELDLSN